MARKTALNKEPNVSIAVPKSEKNKPRGGGYLPGSKAIVDAINKPKKDMQLQRVSPGVYRNGSGQLTNSSGRVMERRQSPQGEAVGNIAGQIAQGVQPMPQDLTGAGWKLPPPPYDAGNQAANFAQQFQGEMPQHAILYTQPGQQQPIQDLMYRYPPGQAPNFEALYNYGQRRQQAQQQPNTVSGLLNPNRFR